jgi:hypothetical protein
MHLLTPSIAWLLMFQTWLQDLSKGLPFCGACGKVCPDGASCNNGTCSCDGGLTQCGPDSNFVCVVSVAACCSFMFDLHTGVGMTVGMTEEHPDHRSDLSAIINILLWQPSLQPVPICIPVTARHTSLHLNGQCRPYMSTCCCLKGNLRHVHVNHLDGRPGPPPSVCWTLCSAAAVGMYRHAHSGRCCCFPV